MKAAFCCNSVRPFNIKNCFAQKLQIGNLAHHLTCCRWRVVGNIWLAYDFFRFVSSPHIDKLAYTLCHRTTYGHFLSNGVWDEQYIWRFLEKNSLAVVYKKPPTMESPLFVIYDDTISEKTRPSSKALHPIEKTGNHQSHLKGKMVWGHQILATLLLRDSQVMPYKIERYEKR